MQKCCDEISVLSQHSHWLRLFCAGVYADGAGVL